MMYSRFTNSNFEGALLYSADLTGSSIENSSLKSAIADRSNLNKVNLRDVDARYVKMRKAHLREAVLEGDFSHADFSQAQMEQIDASKAKLEETVLEEANLRYADLRGALLNKIKAKGVNLSDADLESAKLELAKLSNAIMDGANARYADFKDATLQDVHAHQADFYHAVMERIRGERLDVSGAILNEINLKNSNLTEAVLENIEEYKADFREATLKKVNAKFAEMVACDFSDAIARNMDISGAKFPMSHMERTDLTGVIFDPDTLLLDVNFRDAIGADALKELQENQHLVKTQLFGRSEYGYCKSNDDGTNDRFKCQRIGAAILSSVIGAGAGYTLSGPFTGIAGSVAAGIISDQALHAVKNGYFREQGYISNQLGDKLAELGAVAISAGAGSLYAGVNTIPVAATLCAATGLISPSSIGATVGGALSTYAGINILKSGFTEQSYTKKIIGATLTGLGVIATSVGLSSLANGFNTFAGTVLCGAAAGGIHGGIFAYKQLRDYDEKKHTGMRPEEVYTLSVHKAEESFKKIWPTKNKLICGIVFAALAVGVILALNPLSITIGYSLAVNAVILANTAFAAGTLGFTCGYIFDEKLSFWNKINLDGIKGYFHKQSHDKQFSERDVSKQSDDLGLFSGYIIEPKKQFQQDHSIRTSSSEYFDLGLNSSAIHIKQQVELKKDSVDKFVEAQTKGCMVERTSVVERRPSLIERITAPKTPNTPAVNKGPARVL